MPSKEECLLRLEALQSLYTKYHDSDKDKLAAVEYWIEVYKQELVTIEEKLQERTPRDEVWAEMLELIKK